MNIQDVGGTGNAPDSSRFDTENVNINPANEIKVREEVPDRQEPLDENRDEYVQSLTTIIKGTLYDVTDVRQDKIGRLRRQIENNEYNPIGEKVVEKIVDILLPMGKKTLSVYKKL